ncbi:hypothetical protein OV203_05370 [Nannocystis sp. ILAH1]|uniref:hypothetical protein n=1 Tax=unclassified Nannocystis TaxID=2627009 RepID=UPI00226F17AF|nr:MULTISPECIES: hypothetical protein [unclassified Nannocystis]MCY0986537.1 hypothetical protein [Nannocystis sp. ILAH1]MCY1071417.1 hypothetical protein [Nannocystis sp. RBIL2]
MEDLHIAHANIMAAYGRNIAPLFRGDFARVDEDELGSPFCLSSATRSRPGIALIHDNLVSTRDALLRNIAPIARDADIQWHFQAEGSGCTWTGTELQKTDLAPAGELVGVVILADAATIGLHARLELSPETVFLTLTAGLAPNTLLEIITRTLATLPESHTRSVLPETGAVDETREVTSIKLSISTLQKLEELCRATARGLASEVASYRSLISVKGPASADTYNSGDSLERRYEGGYFPDKTREVKLCMWIFTSQADADSYDVNPVTLKGVFIELKFTLSEATLHIKGDLPNAAQFTNDIYNQVTVGTRPVRNNHKLAHNGLLLVLCTILGIAVSAGCVVKLGETPGVLMTFGLLAIASYITPFAVPRLYPYTIFFNRESERRRRAWIGVCKFLLLGVLLPVIIERMRAQL